MEYAKINRNMDAVTKIRGSGKGFKLTEKLLEARLQDIKLERNF